MALTAGQTRAHYEIPGPLGVGGMGEVYRARDATLDRERVPVSQALDIARQVAEGLAAAHEHDILHRFDEASWDPTGSTLTVVDPTVSIDDHVRIANAGAPVKVPDLGGESSGQTPCYQRWYADKQLSPSSTGFNVTNALELS